MQRKTQQTTILLTMAKFPDRWLLVSDFQKQNISYAIPFVGYEAGTRIWDLARDWYVQKRRSPDNGRFCEYMISYQGILEAKRLKTF